MPCIHIPDLPWEEQHSPARKFHSFCRNISVALGGVRNGGPWCGGHPFDVQLRRIPAGAAVCPFHSHLAQWELFVVQLGRGCVRVGAETQEVGADDVFFHPPGEPHQIRAAAESELVFLLIADNPPVDYWHHPDSQKWGLRAPRKFFRPVEVDYWDGEE
ncbi:MAG: cupin domain-containing protein [Verrucomicrobia bacterium]|nr:cupin domain-containing protein [Verrucomicrobiota bacterium]